MKMKVRSGICTFLPIVALISFMLFFPQGCKNYNQVELYPPCDTVNVTYSANIQPVFSANCLPCHTTANKFGNVILDNLDSARIPARNGLLLKAVTHDQSVVPMPKGGAKLSDCDISKIRRWINLNEPAK